MKSPKLLYLILLLTLLLSACGGAGNAPEAIPTIVLGQENAPTTEASPRSTGDIVASAIIVPAQEAHLAFLIGGNIQKVNVTLGEEVEAGQILVELDNTIALLEVEGAKRALRELTSQREVAAAEEAIAIAQDELEDAQHKVDALDYRRASDTTLDNIEAEIDLAKKQLALASDAYKQVARRPDGDSTKATAILAMTNAQFALNKLQSTYNWYTGSPSETDISIVHAQFSAAEAAFQEAQWYLAALKGEKIPSEASGMKLAQLQQAQDNLESAQNRLDQTRLISPISGIVAEINIIAGEFAIPGKILLVVSDMANLQINTTDLSERDITKVKVGAIATIFIDALNEEFSGKVSSIAPIADTLGGDVIYEITLSFDAPPENALNGMTAEVSIEE